MNKYSTKNICSVLEKVRRKYPNKYNNALQVLSFVYKTVDEYFEKMKEKDIYTAIQEKTNLPEENKTYKTLLKELVSPSFETNNSGSYFKKENRYSIVDSLIDICENEDERFAYFYFNSILVPIDLLKSGYERMTPERYLYNLYVISVVYELTKNNYETFKAIIPKISHILVSIDDLERQSVFIGDKYRNSFEKNIIYIKSLVEQTTLVLSKYPNNEKLNTFLYVLVRNFDREFSEEEKEQYNDMFNIYEKLFKEIEKAKKNEFEINEEVVPKIVDQISNMSSKEPVSKQDEFFGPIALFDNYYLEIMEHIKKVDIPLRKDVLSYLEEGNIYRIVELKQIGVNLSDVLNLIFDSDSYFELKEKINIFSKYFLQESIIDPNLCLSIIESFKTDKYKERIGNIVISYPTDESNLIEESKSIKERMLDIYRLKGLVSNNWKINFSSNKEENTLENITLQIREEIEKNVPKKEQEIFTISPEKIGIPANTELYPYARIVMPPSEPKQKKKGLFSNLKK